MCDMEEFGGTRCFDVVCSSCQEQWNANGDLKAEIKDLTESHKTLRCGLAVAIDQRDYAQKQAEKLRTEFHEMVTNCRLLKEDRDKFSAMLDETIEIHNKAVDTLMAENARLKAALSGATYYFIKSTPEQEGPTTELKPHKHGPECLPDLCSNKKCDE